MFLPPRVAEPWTLSDCGVFAGARDVSRLAGNCEPQAFATGAAYREPSRQSRVEVKAVAAGAVSMAVDVEGNAYLWGEDPVLGHAELRERDAKVPLRVEWLPSTVKVRAGSARPPPSGFSLTEGEQQGFVCVSIRGAGAGRPGRPCQPQIKGKPLVGCRGKRVPGAGFGVDPGPTSLVQRRRSTR